LNTKQQIATRTIVFSIVGNAALALIKAVAGVAGNSFALIADAIESLTDVLSSILVLVGIRYATKPPDDNHPYGHGRAEPLLTFTVVGILLGSAGLIAYESIQHIRTPHEVPATFTLYILAVIIVIKELCYRYVSKRGKQIKSSLLAADAWHHRSDAITSLTSSLATIPRPETTKRSLWSGRTSHSNHEWPGHDIARSSNQLILVLARDG